jgi:hypothetical protein
MIDSISANTQIKFNSSVENLENSLKSIDKETLIIIDFDETLLLRNSTAEYLDQIQPRFLGAIVYFLLSYLKPWHFLPGKYKGTISEDWVRVMILTLILPWNILLWQQKAKQLAQDFINQILADILIKKPENKIIIATLGFNLIVNPIIKHLKLPINQVIACDFWQGFKDRQAGKYQLIINHLTQKQLENSVYLTDNYHHDAQILETAKFPHLIVFENAIYTHPMGNIYLPFYYMEKVKRPNQKYFLTHILLGDLPIILISFSWLSNQPIFHSISILFLTLSFWCIYEIGYYENDLNGELYEKNPILSEAYQKYKKTVKFGLSPWLFSLIFAVLGIVILENIKINQSFTQLLDLFNNQQLIKQILISLGYWISFLILTRAIFWLYNRVEVGLRIGIYPILQMLRLFGFALVTITNFTGVISLTAHLIGNQWIPYLVYRYNGKRDLISSRLICLFIFLLLSFILFIASKDLTIFNPLSQYLIMLIFLTFRSGKNLIKIIKNLKINSLITN